MDDILQQVLNFLTELMVSYGFKIIASGLILFIGSRIVKSLLKRLKNGILFRHLDDSLKTFSLSLIRIGLYILLFISAAAIVGIPTASFITILASAGVAIGLAIQGALANFAGGVMLLLFKPFKVGDFIETTDCAGTVSSITVFYTVLQSPDNRQLTLPNATMTNSPITNYSAFDTRRVDFEFSASQKTDIDKFQSLLLNLCAKHPLILKDPPPQCRLVNANGSTLEFILRVFTNTPDYWDVKFDINEQAKKAFIHHGFDYPYPQLGVHLETSDPPSPKSP